MKRIIPSLILLACLGCQTTGPTDVNRVAGAVKIAAFTGTSYAMIEHPEWRPAFTDAEKELKFIEAQPTIDFATIMAVVMRLPVKELKSEKAVLAITAGTMLLYQYGDSLPIDQIENLRPIVVALREGIALGLGQPPSKALSRRAQ